MFQICPRLTSLTIRHAPYLSSMQEWKSTTVTLDDQNSDGVGQLQQPAAPPGVSRNGVVEEELVSEEGVNENGSGNGSDPQSPVLRSLTVDNCPGLSLEVSTYFVLIGTWTHLFMK